jgi:uncharacterized protein
MTDWSRRTFLQALAVSIPAVQTVQRSAVLAAPTVQDLPPACRIRTITAGVTLPDIRDLRPIDAALSALTRTREDFKRAGFEVQTIRVSTSPIMAGLDASQRDRALIALRALDQLLQAHDALGSIGPCSVDGRYDAALPPWVAELIRTTGRLNCSIRVASPQNGVYPGAARMAAEAMAALALATPGGIGNFRFAAAAHVPAGTPFFPVAYHDGPDALALGLESASLVEQGVTGAPSSQEATTRLQALLNRALAPIERLGVASAKREGRVYLGIDSSPAPSLDRSIGAALEALMRQPFGGHGTVEACAAVTAALRALTVKTCGYAGLMLPVLEDPVLARRASEGRYGLGDLLLFSSVCGTGLDVVPLPGDTPPDVLGGIVRDMAALAAKWAKPLSARLFLVPGKKAGETATFTDPLLTACRVLSAG